MKTTNGDKTPTPKMSVRVLMFFFGLVYFAQGIGQVSGLVGQPLNFYLKNALGFTPSQIAAWMSILIIPWTIKPLYGLLSDFLPIMGSRRKSWLLIMNMLAATGFIMLFGATGIHAIITALLISSFGTAFCDVVTDALMVEQGRITGKTQQFQGTQWMWMAVASIFSSILGGYLCEWFSPASALHIASAVTIFAPMLVFACVWFLIKDEPAKISAEQFKSTGKSYLKVLKSKKIIFVALFTAFWNFSPGFGTPFYFFMTDTLKFDQSFIGQLGAIGSVASVIGAWAFTRWLAPKLSTLQLVNISIAIGFVGTLAYLLIGGFWSAIIVTFVVGLAAQVAFLTVMGVAAEACPKNAEGFAFAALMSVSNLATQGSSNFGAYLYDHVFNSQLAPLIWVSAIFTLATYLLVPLLKAVQNDPDVTE
jgi:predicted MFS family arabinose efflux permease